MVCILFLIQTVLNFAASPSEIDIETTSYTSIDISQVPSGGDFTDHVRSIQIGAHELLFQPGGCNRNTPYLSSGNPKYFISEITECQPFKSDSRRTYSFIDGNKKELSAFVEAVEAEHNIKFSLSEQTKDNQDVSQNSPIWPRAVTLFWRPNELEDDLMVRVSYCLCNLSSTDNNRIAPPEWNLPRPILLHPHPLVIRSTYVEQGVSHAVHVDYLNSDGPNINSTSNPSLSARRFDLHNDKNCMGSYRSDFSRIVEVNLSEFQS